MSESPVLACTPWRTNAELIADCARLGYLKDTDRILDPTYGRGIWWQEWTPQELQKPVEHDFRDMDWFADASFDAVAYDPPYVSVGGRKTTTLPDMHDRYGLTDAPTTPKQLQKLINDGLTEMHRVVKPRGYVLTKCQDYVSSGKLWLGTHWTLTHALELGFECVDRLEHYGTPRPQPPGRRQVHARRNLSTLFVFRKGRA